MQKCHFFAPHFRCESPCESIHIYTLYIPALLLLPPRKQAALVCTLRQPDAPLLSHAHSLQQPGARRDTHGGKSSSILVVSANRNEGRGVRHLMDLSLSGEHTATIFFIPSTSRPYLLTISKRYHQPVDIIGVGVHCSVAAAASRANPMDLHSGRNA